MDTHKPSVSYSRSGRFIIPLLLLTLVCSWLSYQAAPSAQAQADPILEVEPITWNVFFLDTASPSAGPVEFLTGVEVCNASDAGPATDLQVDISDVNSNEDSNDYLSVLGDRIQSVPVLGPGECRDFYFKIGVEPDPNAIGKDGPFTITAASGNTSVERDDLLIVVAGFVRDPALQVDSITGPASPLFVGETVQIVVNGTAAGAGFGSLVHTLNYDPGILQLHQVNAEYSNTDTGESTWIDPCGIVSDPDDPAFLTCTLTDTETITGTFTVTFTMDVIGTGSSVIVPLLYGHPGVDGNSIVYNADFGSDLYPFTAQQPVQTATVTSTEPGATSTQTATVTATGATNTPTRTPTRTATGIAGSPTATGSITPNPNSTKSVSPTSANIGQFVTFTIRVGNNGTAPAQNVVLTDTFASFAYLDVDDASTTQGSANINGKVVTVNIGTVMPRQTVTVTIRIRVNNNARGTQNPCNTATMTFTGGTRTSNQMCFRVVGSSTLPGTGENPAPIPPDEGQLPLILFAVVTGIAGLGALRMAAWAWKEHRAALRWYLGAGFVLTAAAVALVACSVQLPGETGDDDLTMTMTAGTAEVDPTPTATLNPLAIMPAYLFATPVAIETLPSYPIPTPVLETYATPLPESEDTEPDTTRVERIVIPDLGLDAVVAYVPYDGSTWLIQGLRHEIAWLGDTSWPGLGGNTGFAGHVTLRGEGNGPFRYIMDLEPGDTVQLYTERNVYTYRVSEKKVVEEVDLGVLAQSSESQITLITCVEWDESLEMYLRRLAVTADLVDVERIQVRGSANR